jgi:hypothetical protein
MKVFVATVVTLTMLAAPAVAQSQFSTNQLSNKSPRAQAQAARDHARENAEIEREYNATLKRTGSPGPAKKSDPWARIRPQEGADTMR